MKVEISDEDRKALKKVFQRFSSKDVKGKEEIFYDLCFALCAPQTTFTKNHQTINNLINENFYHQDISIKKMHEIVRPTRFFRRKTQYLLSAKRNFEKIFSEICKYLGQRDGEEVLRSWLCNEIQGLGMKASSHFLRNLGFMNVAILDVHILRFLGAGTNNISSKQKYEKLEKDFQGIARENGLSPAFLDALIWKKCSNTPWEKFEY